MELVLKLCAIDAEDEGSDGFESASDDDCKDEVVDLD